jgi:hypothetical protein
MKKKLNKDFFKNYLKIFSYLSILLFLSIGLINFNIDPSKIYSEKYKFIKKKNLDLKMTLKKLNEEKNGIIIKEDIWNERDIVRELATYSNKSECIIFGSSQVKMISKFGSHRSLKKTCSSILNLGVNGGVIEDYISLSKQIKFNKSLPQKVVIAIHPWTLNFNRDSRWLYYKKDYQLFSNLLYNEINSEKKINLKKKDLYFFSLFKNLISYDYFLESLKMIKIKDKEAFFYVKKKNLKNNFDKEILLFDGSRIRPKKSQKNNIDINSGNHNYKIIKKIWFDNNAINFLLKYIEYLKEQGIEPILLMTPYHPDVWKAETEVVVTAMKIIEPKVIEIGKLKKLLVLGSFNPSKVGCKKNEFHDEMHPNKACASKFEDVYISYK